MSFWNIWRTDEWSPRQPWPWEHARSVYGEPLGDWVMGRKIKGRWQYRNMTETEIEEWQDTVQAY